MSDAKRLQRADMRRVRAGIPDREARTQRLWMALLDSFAPAGVAGRHLLAFVGVGSEPDTTTLLDTLQRERANVYLPRVTGEEIVAVRFESGVPMEIGAHAIPAPTGVAVDPSVFDIVIVPGLAFTSDGRRLGQGGGYYDRYLPRLRADCVTVGVCFHEQLVESVPGETHDQRVGRVVTDDVQQ